MTYYFDVDGVLANFHEKYNPQKRFESLTYSFIRNLNPFMNNIEIVKTLITNNNKVYICTLVANENTKKARIDWLKEYLPEIPEQNIIAIIGHGKKCDYIKEDGILIDDKKANCNQWIKAGYKAIWLENKGETIKI